MIDNVFNNISFGPSESKWEIFEVSHLDSNLTIGNNECRGTIHFTRRHIYIDEALTLFDRKQTLMHELTHAMIYEYQLERRENYNEELLCDFVAKYGPAIVNCANSVYPEED